MNAYLKELTKLLVEQVLVEYDAKPNASMGRWLLGPYQKDKQAQKEKNTRLEDQLRRWLDDHYGGMPNPKAGELLMKLKPEIEKGNYSNILQAPSGYVYRGMALFKDDFLNIIGKPNKKSGIIKKSGVLQNDNFQTSSWTLNKSVALNFAIEPVSDDFLYGSEADIHLIFKANTQNPKNNFFVNPNVLSQKFYTGSFIHHLGEEEVIAVGDVWYDEIIFYMPKVEHSLARRKQDFSKLIK